VLKVEGDEMNSESTKDRYSNLSNIISTIKNTKLPEEFTNCESDKIPKIKATARAKLQQIEDMFEFYLASTYLAKDDVLSKIDALNESEETNDSKEREIDVTAKPTSSTTDEPALEQKMDIDLNLIATSDDLVSRKINSTEDANVNTSAVENGVHDATIIAERNKSSVILRDNLLAELSNAERIKKLTKIICETEIATDCKVNNAACSGWNRTFDVVLLEAINKVFIYFIFVLIASTL
jgi:hypothetical protein